MMQELKHCFYHLEYLLKLLTVGMKCSVGCLSSWQPERMFDTTGEQQTYFLPREKGYCPLLPIDGDCEVLDKMLRKFTCEP
jgi:hypothetical protein